ncbi:MAG: GDYXXLXY domain-containing protein, partial [Pseudomonadota bacterium]|nr:GDYXXLXY domain-containing protein [Pseudomonadota bacterium]
MSFTRLRPLLIGLSVLLTLVFVVWTVGRNEQTIAKGRDAFVELRPVDPLSLVQGYYMALNMQVDLPPREGLGIADARAVFT